MKRTDLTKLGLTDDAVIDGIMALHGKDVEAKNTDNATLTGERDALKVQLVEAGTTIEGFKKLDPAGLQKAVEDYKAAAEKATQDGAASVAAIKFDHALEKELTEARAKDPADVIPHLKKDMLKLDENGKFIGLAEQLKPLQESKSYLFESDEKTAKIVLGGQSKSVLGDPQMEAMRKGAGLSSPTK